MPQPIKVRGRFATAQDTAKTLGVSASRTKELIELAKKFTGEIHYRNSEGNWARKKTRTGSSATAVRTKKSGRHAEAAKKKTAQVAKAHR